MNKMKYTGIVLAYNIITVLENGFVHQVKLETDRLEDIARVKYNVYDHLLALGIDVRYQMHAELKDKDVDVKFTHVYTEAENAGFIYSAIEETDNKKQQTIAKAWHEHILGKMKQLETEPSYYLKEPWKVLAGQAQVANAIKYGQNPTSDIPQE